MCITILYFFLLPLRTEDCHVLHHWLVACGRGCIQTACSLAVERGHASTARLLLEHRVSAYEKTCYSRQPLLHRATSRRRIDIVELLLNKGASIDLVSNKHRTAYTLNADTDNNEGKEFPALRIISRQLANSFHSVLKYLRDRGADIDYRTRGSVH